MIYRNLNISRQILSVAIGLSLILLVFLLSFSASQVLESKNAIKQIVNRNRSFSVIEKIDRNFYERFGDVQAFAYNKLAREAIDSATATPEIQKFINTMVYYYVLYDLMMIVDANGKVVAVNTTDKNNVAVQTGFLLGKDFSNEEWFRVCTSSDGPVGGAWYSDFMEHPDVSKIYGSNGWGMAFAAPIRNEKNEIIGVWYNYASWRDVTQGIRMETEELLTKETAEAFVLITDKNGNVIDASDEKLVLNLQVQEDIMMDMGISFSFNGRNVSSNDFIIGSAQGKGAYTYKGNNWKTFTFMPKDTFSFTIFFGELRTLTAVTLIILLAGILAFMTLSKNLSGRIKGLQNVIYSLSIGELVELKKTDWKDEVGQMTNSLRMLTAGLRKTSLFANEIGQGNLSADFEPLSDKDVLGLSLVSMRNNLAKIKADEEKRSWVTQGLAEFGDKLRRSTDNIGELCDSILVFLCKYLKANQGAIFIMEQDEGESNFLQLVACYAWNKKKYMTGKVGPGEGLVGQVWQEGELVYLTEVPDGFVRITSGLGDINPNAIILLPLKQNDEVMGVIEMAFFNKLESHEIELLRKISENLASSLASAKINERTKKLLDQTQVQTEALRSQEEEMRQNLEEMKATQEEFNRREAEYIREFERLKNSNGVAILT
jgi:hypothetical protein